MPAATVPIDKAVRALVHGEGSEQAARWFEPLIHQLRHGEELRVLQTLQDLVPVVESAAARTVVEREWQYLETHRDHIHYATFEESEYPLGSGAMESACRQFQTRFKRSGQFWTQAGDEKVLCLCTYRMSGRWTELWPHPQAA